MKTEQTDLKVLNRDVIKYIAMLTMLLNHISHVFLTPGTVFKEVFEDVGYFTAITMCYFLVEGYEYTRSKKKYALRLFLFAVISQMPFWYAFRSSFTMVGLNMIFTLFICFLILVVREKMQNGFLKAVVITLLVLVTIISDWQLLAAVFTLLFANYKDSKKKMMISYIFAFLLFAGMNIMNYSAAGYSAAGAVIHGLFSGVAILVSGIVILFFYNGKRAEHGREFSKWFFYIFYPGHLLVIGLIYQFMFA